VILAVCLALGILLRLAAGHSFAQLAHVRLRGEALLLGFLCVQAVLPLVRLTGTAARFAFWLWIATFPVLIAIAWRNRAHPGMAVIALGLLLNLVAVSVNGGMPVMGAAAAAAGLRGQLVLPIGDFVHVVGTAATRLPWLADVVPLPGPVWARFVPSAGDLLLYAGVVAFLAAVKPSADGDKPVGSR
jgi:hypothetical protein